jgi:hypothetical protein
MSDIKITPITKWLFKLVVDGETLGWYERRPRNKEFSACRAAHEMPQHDDDIRFNPKWVTVRNVSIGHAILRKHEYKMLLAPTSEIRDTYCKEDFSNE